MRAMRIVAATMLGLLMLGGTASAAYLPQFDIRINLTLPKVIPIPSGLAQTTFDAQEKLHNYIESATGISIDHSYIWVNVNGQDVLAIDPLTVWTY